MNNDFNYAKYLASTLIIQFHNKPKAIATIEALGKMFPVDLVLQVRDAFSVDTAVGKQLDILAKYVGVKRFYTHTDGEIITLNDEELRMLIKFACICNTSNMSQYDLDTSLYNFFGRSVRASSNGNMAITFFVRSDSQIIVDAAIQQRVLPTPIGVQSNQVVIQDEDFFGFVEYDNLSTVYKQGFLEYSDPDKAGEMLNYDKATILE